MAETTQDLKNHTRLHPPFHFFVAPVLLLHVIWSVSKCFRNPTWDTAEALLLSLALFVMAFLVRANPLRAQDRLIRLEERLRFERVLTPELAAQALTLSPGQIVALRFAPDAELPTLVRQIMSGQISKPAEIKKAIGQWRGDYFRV